MKIPIYQRILNVFGIRLRIKGIIGIIGYCKKSDRIYMDTKCVSEMGFQVNEISREWVTDMEKIKHPGMQKKRDELINKIKEKGKQKFWIARM